MAFAKEFDRLAIIAIPNSSGVGHTHRAATPMIMDDIIDEILAEMLDPVQEEHQLIDLDSQAPPWSSY